MRRVSTRVLPDPGPAMVSSGAPSCATAPRCGSLSPSRMLSGSAGMVDDAVDDAVDDVVDDVVAGTVTGRSPSSRKPVRALMTSSTLVRRGDTNSGGRRPRRVTGHQLPASV